MNEFSIGDRVRLMSGGPAMTVIGLVETGVMCSWFTGGGGLSSYTFPGDSLTRVPLTEPWGEPANPVAIVPGLGAAIEAAGEAFIRHYPGARQDEKES